MERLECVVVVFFLVPCLLLFNLHDLCLVLMGDGIKYVLKLGSYRRWGTAPYAPAMYLA
jgi:hypothetical protein